MCEPRLMIVDDEPLARQRLRDLLGDIGGYAVVAEAGHGVDALHQLQTQAVDIVLLDIRMPVMDGIELAQHLQGLPQPPALIFTTAYDQHAVQAFELNAVDYILKPIRGERLAAALRKVQPLTRQQTQGLQALQPAHSHLRIHSVGRIELVAVSEIVYVRAEEKYLTVKTRQHQYLLEDTLSRIAQQYADRFVRIHRNALVARAAIAGFKKILRPGSASDTHWVVCLHGVEETLVVSRRHYDVLKTMHP